MFGIALLVRLAHVAAIRDSAGVLHPWIDPAAYLARAQEILAGRWFPEDVFFQDPLYPYLLAGLQALSGGWRLGPYVGHAVVGAASCGLLVLLGRRFSSPTAGVVAGFLAALYAPWVYQDGQLEKHSFALAAFLGALLAFPGTGPIRWGRVALSAVLLGAGGILRGNFLLVAPALALVAALQAQGAGLLRRCLVVGAFGLAALAPILPFTIHNVRVSGTFLLTTAQAGTSFYLGNNPQNSSGGVHHLSFVRQVPEHEPDDWKREAERRAGRTLTRAEISSFWFRESLHHIVRDPGLGWWCMLLAKKMELALNAYEVPDNTSIQWVERFSPVVRWSPVRFATIGPLGLLGALWALRRLRARLPIFVAFGVYAATMLLFPVSERFRALLAAAFLLAAGEALVELARAAATRRFGVLAVGTLGLAASVVAVDHEPWLQTEDTNLRERNALLKSYHDEAAAWINAREWARAEAVLQEAMTDPWRATKARLNLDLAIVLWYGQGRLDEAKALAVKSVPALLGSGESVPDGYRLYADLVEAGGDREEASYWRARFEAAETFDAPSLVEHARRALAAGDSARATGILDELVFVDGLRPARVAPAAAYEMLARLLLARGKERRASEITQSLLDRTGAVPDDLRPLLPAR